MLIYQNYAKEILSKLNRITEMTNHSLSIGTYHESIIKSFLKNFLSNRFSVKTGFIKNYKKDITSKQIDILVIDEFYPSAYLFKDDDFVIVTPEAVVCAIEIKTNFDKNNFIDISEKAFNYREVCEDKGFFMAFCFKNSIKNRDLIYEWHREIQIPDVITNYPMLIYILDSYIIRSIPEPLCKPSGNFFIIRRDLEENLEEIILADFLVSILKTCEIKVNINNSDTITKIFGNKFDTLFEIKHYCMKYGVGMLPLEEINLLNGENIFMKK